MDTLSINILTFDIFYIIGHSFGENIMTFIILHSIAMHCKGNNKKIVGAWSLDH